MLAPIDAGPDDAPDPSLAEVACTANEPRCAQCGDRLSFARPPMLCDDCAVEDLPHTD
jgi:hypothetical protein